MAAIISKTEKLTLREARILPKASQPIRQQTPQASAPSGVSGWVGCALGRAPSRPVWLRLSFQNMEGILFVQWLAFMNPV